MIRSIVVILFAIVISGLAQAQTESQSQSQGQTKTTYFEDQKIQVYVLGGLSHASGGGNAFQFGGGGEFFVFKRVAAGGEYSYIKQPQGATGLNNLSGNGYFHFLSRDKSKFDPFATGGFSRFFAQGGGFNAFNFGGGANYWFSQGLGLRFDFRDNVVRGGGSLAGLRGGVVIGF